ncbi:CsbD family protein [Hyphomonas sp. WL0036]|uniref:CsbD family protein n=1 Tax=Hyphomonas sediminis TaxID=2866160 RepID=UPI001C7E750E|nr:CsbD family protein [Hyphomonas sediminis]MBY9068013.1 CsbD family protein [Hyphomonas sediminis]
MTNKNTVKGVGNQIAGNAKEAAGKLTGNKMLEAEGRVQELKGDAQRAAGKAEDKAKKAADNFRKSF